MDTPNGLDQVVSLWAVTSPPARSSLASIAEVAAPALRLCLLPPGKQRDTRLNATADD